MRTVVQRIRGGQVRVNGKVVADAGFGLLALVGFCRGDTPKVVDWLAQKLITLRVFEDSSSKINLSLKDVHGDLVVVSQFTLCATLKKGTRPSFDDALPFTEAQKLYEALLERLRSIYPPEKIFSGVFGATMEVDFVNYGPVTVIVEKVL